MAAESNALTDLLAKATSFQDQTLSRWYKESEEMRAFPSQVAIMERSRGDWTTLLNRYGELAGDHVRPALNTVSELLDKQQARVRSMQRNCCMGCWKKAVFPSELTKAMDEIIDSFEKIPRHMSQRLWESDAANVLPFSSDPRYVPLEQSILEVRRALETESTRTGCCRVVILYGEAGEGKTAMAKHLALFYQEQSTSFFEDGVIFLRCGEAAADAKTLFARLWNQLGYGTPALVHHDYGSNEYETEGEGENEGTEDNSNGGSLAAVGQQQRQPEQQQQQQAKQRQQKQLEQQQQDTTDRKPAKRRPPKRKASHIPTPSSSSFTTSQIEPELIERLRKTFSATRRKRLIILDDVRSAAIATSLLVPSEGVTYLITARADEELSTDPTTTPATADADRIRIGKPSRNEAREIFRKRIGKLSEDNGDGEYHDGEDGGDVLVDLQEIMDAIFDVSKGNPLILANLATTIHRERALHIGEWMGVKKHLLYLLDENNMSCRSSSRLLVYDDFRPVESYDFDCMSASMTMAIDAFPREVHRLLLLFAMVHDTSASPIPEVVFKILFKSLRGNLFRFNEAVRFLEDNGFIQIEFETFMWHHQGCQRTRAWSIHELQQCFIREEKRLEIPSTVAALLQHESEIVRALCVLYSHESWQTLAAYEFGVSPDLLMNEERCSTNHVKPFVQLLHQDSEGSEEWEQEAHDLAAKVIIHFLRTGRLEDDAMSGLLTVMDAAPAACRALRTMVQMFSRSLVTAEHTLTIGGLMEILGAPYGVHNGEDGEDSENDEEDYSRASEALFTLGSLFVGDRNRGARSLVYRSPNALLDLCDLLVSFDEDGYGNFVKKVDVLVPFEVRLCVLWIIRNFAWSEDPNEWLDVGRLGILLEILLEFVEMGELELGMDEMEEPLIQEVAMDALQRLVTVVPESRMQMILIPGALEKILRLLERSMEKKSRRFTSSSSDVGDKGRSRSRRMGSRNFASSVVENARLTLVCIAIHSEQNATHIASLPGALESIAGLLRDNMQPSLQEIASSCLGFIAMHSWKNATRIASLKGVLEDVISLLGRDNKPSVQEKAAKCLANIALHSEEHVTRIASFPGALENIVDLLRKDTQPALQEIATTCLWIFAIYSCENAMHIASLPGVLEVIVHGLLRKDDQPSLQNQAIALLAEISYASKENAALIVSLPKALDSIVNLLGKDRILQVSIQEYAARCLSSLLSFKVVGSKEDCCGKGAISTMPPNAIDGLVELLERNLNAGVQYEVAKALALIKLPVADGMTLGTSQSLEGKGDAKILLGMFDEALHDFNDALEIESNRAQLFSRRSFVKAMLQDFEGALEDADEAILLDPSSAYLWQERGVLKRMIQEDLVGALSDLHRGLELKPNDYEGLKQRGYVKFLLGDEDGAHADAEMATKVKSRDSRKPGRAIDYLGVLPVTYLEFVL